MVETSPKVCRFVVDFVPEWGFLADTSYKFEWDPEKAEANRRKHDVSFHEASTAFADPLAMLTHDPDHSVGEERHLVLDASSTGRLLVVSHAERSPRTRLISARPATRNGRKHHEQDA